MLDNKNSNFNLIVCGIIFFVMILFVLIVGNNTTPTIQKDNTIDRVTTDEIIKSLNINNYSLKVTKLFNNNRSEWNYRTDGNIDIYDTNNEVYLVYKNNKYLIDSETKELNNIESIDYLIDNYTDIKFIKNILSSCNFEYVTDTEVSCELNLNNYISSYNNYYGTMYETNNLDRIIYINIKHSNNNIYSMTLNYSSVYEYFNNIEKDLKYEIIVNDRQKNDFNDIFEYYKVKLSN